MAVDLEDAYDLIAAAINCAASKRDFAIASAEAERLGLVELGDGKPSQSHIWEKVEGDKTLWLRWRWYDQSQVFSIQPDMNILSLELRSGDAVLRKVESRYED